MRPVRAGTFSYRRDAFQNASHATPLHSLYHTPRYVTTFFAGAMSRVCLSLWSQRIETVPPSSSLKGSLSNLNLLHCSSCALFHQLLDCTTDADTFLNRDSENQEIGVRPPYHQYCNDVAAWAHPDHLVSSWTSRTGTHTLASRERPITQAEECFGIRHAGPAFV